MVPRIGNVYCSLIINCHAPRLAQSSLGTASLRNGEQPAHRAEFLNAIVLRIGHVEITGGIDGNTGGTKEGAGGRARTAKREGAVRLRFGAGRFRRCYEYASIGAVFDGQV